MALYSALEGPDRSVVPPAQPPAAHSQCPDSHTVGTHPHWHPRLEARRVRIPRMPCYAMRCNLKYALKEPQGCPGVRAMLHGSSLSRPCLAGANLKSLDAPSAQDRGRRHWSKPDCRSRFRHHSHRHHQPRHCHSESDWHHRRNRRPRAQQVRELTSSPHYQVPDGLAPGAVLHRLPSPRPRGCLGQLEWQCQRLEWAATGRSLALEPSLPHQRHRAAHGLNRVCLQTLPLALALALARLWRRAKAGPWTASAHPHQRPQRCSARRWPQAPPRGGAARAPR